MMKGLSLIFLLMVVSSLPALAQVPDAEWNRVEESYAKLDQLRTIRAEMSGWRKKAIERRDFIEAARCYQGELTITDRLTEDSSYFRNSFFIDSILQSNAPLQLKMMMHVLQAVRLDGFSPKNDRSRYSPAPGGIDYAGFNSNMLDSIARDHMDTALQLVKGNNYYDWTKYVWLKQDLSELLYKPSLQDVFYYMQADRYGRHLWNLQGSRKNEWLALSSVAFVSYLDTMQTGNVYTDRLLSLYRDWMVSKMGKVEERDFLVSLLRERVFNGNHQSDKLEPWFQEVLEREAASSNNMVKAHSLQQLIKGWADLSENYFPSAININYLYPVNEPANPAFEEYALKAINTLRNNRELFDSFPALRVKLQMVERVLSDKKAAVRMQWQQATDTPILMEVRYRNADTLYYRVLRRKWNQMTLIDSAANNVVKTGYVVLPVSNDYNVHVTYAMLDPFPIGKYTIETSEFPLEDRLTLNQTLNFEVSAIAVAIKDNRLYVFDRKTGMPVQGARVTSYVNEKNKGDFKITNTETTGKNGYVVMKSKYGSNVFVSYNSDTVTATLDEPIEYTSEFVYDKDDYDALWEFYEENSEMHVYTDRSIYRPGQQVYYKVILMTRNPRTGKRMLFTKKNLGAKLFSSVYKKFLKESDPWIFLYDEHNRSIDSVKLRVNDYGSMSGVFRIPALAATGEWYIEADYLDTEGGEFRVEEYKRPTFEVKLEKPTAELLPGDPFNVNVKLKSFSGATLGNVKTVLTVSRSAYYLSYMALPDKISRELVLIDSILYTGNHGNVTLLVKDSMLSNWLSSRSDPIKVTYFVTAKVTDETGETYEEKINFYISGNPLTFSFASQAVYELNEINNIKYSVNHVNAGRVERPVRFRLFKKPDDAARFSGWRPLPADRWIQAASEFQQYFPFIGNENKSESDRVLLLDTLLDKKASSFKLDARRFGTGSYLMEVSSSDGEIIRGRREVSFEMYDRINAKPPDEKEGFVHLPSNTFKAGDTLKLITYSPEATYVLYHVAYTTGRDNEKVREQYLPMPAGKKFSEWHWKIPSDATGNGVVTRISVVNQQVALQTKSFFIFKPVKTEPEIVLEKFRSTLKPGEQEQFQLSVKTGNERVVAELMTTLYDASLDKLEEHSWRIPAVDYPTRVESRWKSDINTLAKNEKYNYRENFSVTIFLDLFGIGWRNDSSRIISGMNTSLYRGRELTRSGEMFIHGLIGRTPGLAISSESSLNEVVVTGWGTAKKMSLTGAVASVRIRGISDLSGYQQPLVVIDGIVYNGAFSSIDPNSITELMILKDAEATALYGSRAASGVLIISTKGEIVLPPPPTVETPARKNFNETAFFFPAVRAGRDGKFHISFTMPESVTEWNWKLLAHTKNAEFITKEKVLVTQLPLMIQPNMPRLLYNGDSIFLRSRISNLDTVTISGTSSIRVEDVVTGEDLTNAFKIKSDQSYSTQPRGNTYTGAWLYVPENQRNPVKITVRATSPGFSDGEEHVIPIASRKIFVQQAQPFAITVKDTLLNSPVPGDVDMLGVGISIEPKRETVLLHSLAWLANYSFECAEQLSNKILARSMALGLMRKDSVVRSIFQSAKAIASNDPLVKNQLSDEKTSAAMPWLEYSHKNNSERIMLLDLLDTVLTRDAIVSMFKKLSELQNTDGGMTWFPGGETDEYISLYVLRQLALLDKDGYVPSIVNQKSWTNMVEDLLKYTDRRLKIVSPSNSFTTYKYFVRSYWENKYPLDIKEMDVVKRLLDSSWINLSKMPLRARIELVLLTLRTKAADSSLQALAKKQLLSIREMAIEDGQGLRWKEYSDSESFRLLDEESMAMIREAFDEAGMDQMVNEGIQQWILQTRSTHRWQSTKAVGAAISILEKSQKSVTSAENKVKTSVGKTVLQVNDNPVTGNNFAYVKTPNAPGSLQIEKEQGNVAEGQVVWLYFTEDPVAAGDENNIRLSKLLYKVDGKKELVRNNSILEAGEEVEVVIRIETTTMLEYVFLEDRRAAAFEPLDASSGYDWQGGMPMYKSVRDHAVQFFVNAIPAGKHEIRYRMRVMQEGSFTNGHASLQCMYEPGKVAYSGTQRVYTAGPKER